MTSTVSLLLLILTLICHKSRAFSPFCRRAHFATSSLRASNDKNIFNDDDLFNNNKNNNNNGDDSKLGIDIGKMLEPLTPEQAEQLRAEASELISDRVAQGVDDIEALRKQLKQELEVQSRERLAKSEKTAQEASQRLLSKIDKITDDFMSKSESMRKSTKLAAAADRANEGKGVELGSWGSIGGASVNTGSGLLGSVASSNVKEATTTTAKSDHQESATTTTTAPKENRIIIIADPSQVCISVECTYTDSRTDALTLPPYIHDRTNWPRRWFPPLQNKCRAPLTVCRWTY